MLSEGSLKWLENHCISQETAEHFNLDTEERHFPELQCNRRAIRIPYVVNGTDIGSRWVDSKENWTGDLPAPQLWNIDGRKPPTLFICDNEIAVMALHGVGIHAICPSDYANPKAMADIPYLHDVLSGFGEVCLLLSKTRESVGWEQSLSHLFAEHKAATTRFHDGCLTVIDVIKQHGENGIRDIIEAKTQLPPHGIKSFSDYLKEIHDYYHGKKVNLYSTGFAKIDPLFKIQLGALHIIGGQPGAGKGEFLDQIMVNTIKLHDFRWLLYTPESMPPDYYARKIIEKTVGLPMKGKGRMDEATMLNGLAKVNNHIKFLPPEDESLTLDHILDLARLAVSKYRINCLVVDPYNEVEHEIRDKDTESNYVSMFLSKVRNFGRVHNVATFIVAHPTKLKKNEITGEYPPPRLYEISGSAHWANKADVGLSVWRSFQTQTNEVSIFFQKIRNRDVGRVGEAKLYWDWKTGILTDEPTGPYVVDSSAVD